MTTSAPAARPAGSRSRGLNSGTPARREQIARAAVASFAQHGYERASLRDIAARAGVTHAALLRHFSGKDELLLAALALREEEEEQLAARILESGMAAERVLSAVLREEFEDPEHQRNWMALTVAATDPSHPAHTFFATRRERMRTRFAAGSLPTALGSAHLSADEKVTLVLAIIDGLRVQALLDPSREVLGLLETFMKLVITAQDAAGELTGGGVG